VEIEVVENGAIDKEEGREESAEEGRSYLAAAGDGVGVVLADRDGKFCGLASLEQKGGGMTTEKTRTEQKKMHQKLGDRQCRCS